MEHQEIARLIDANRAPAIDYAVGLALREPFWEQRFGPGIAERLALDFEQNLAALAKSVRYRSPMIFDDHMRWRRSQIQGFGCSSGHIREMCAHLWSGLAGYIPPHWQPIVSGYMQAAIDGLAYPTAAPKALAAEQTQLAEDLAAATFDVQWHWQAAYHTDGRARLLYETWFLLDYLTDALGTGKADLVNRHLRALRQDLARRGLCTAHGQQLAWLLSEQIEARLPPGPAEEARRLLLGAAATLDYARESCNALLSAQEPVVAEVAGRLIGAGLAPNSQETAIEVGWYLSYLTDSMAAGDAAPLLGYTRWMQQWLASQGLPDSPLRASYEALRGALDRYLPEYAAREAAGLLQAAQRAL